jgi:ligand-binding sensor domain-containing protein
MFSAPHREMFRFEPNAWTTPPPSTMPSRLGTLLTGMLLSGLPAAFALDQDLRISQYAHTAWRVRDGAFAGAPSAITRTTDGYVWIGTVSGLLRFDGARFVPFVPPPGSIFPNPAVISGCN